MTIQISLGNYIAHFSVNICEKFGLKKLYTTYTIIDASTEMDPYLAICKYLGIEREKEISQAVLY